MKSTVCVLILLAFICPASAEKSLIETLRDRGAPQKVDFQMEMNVREWNRYLTDMEQRGRNGLLDDVDFEIFSKVMSLEDGIHHTFVNIFTSSAGFFKGSKYEKQIGNLCKDILADKKTTDWAKAWAGEALSIFNDDSAVNSLFTLYLNPNPSISNVARRSLGRLGHGVPALYK